MSVANTILLGKRCVFTSVTRERRYKKGSSEESYAPEYEYVETSRKLYRGIVAALITTGDHHYVTIVMLYPDGSLRSHSIEHITMEDASARPWRADEWATYVEQGDEKPVRRDG